MCVCVCGMCEYGVCGYNRYVIVVFVYVVICVSVAHVKEMVDHFGCSFLVPRRSHSRQHLLIAHPWTRRWRE